MELTLAGTLVLVTAPALSDAPQFFPLPLPNFRTQRVCNQEARMIRPGPSAIALHFRVSKEIPLQFTGCLSTFPTIIPGIFRAMYKQLSGFSICPILYFLRTLAAPSTPPAPPILSLSTIVGFRTLHFLDAAALHYQVINRSTSVSFN